jgi:RNA polymerase sigma factor (sigma-70 family)
VQFVNLESFLDETETNARDVALRLAIEHRRMIESYAYAITRDFHLVDDIYQEVALLVVAQWARMPADGGEIPWLKEITRRKALELIRKQARMPRRLSDEAMQQVEAALPAPTDHDLADAMARCVEKLPADARQAIRGRYGENLAVDEIAKRMGRTVQGAYAVLKRARLILEACVNRARGQSGANP